MKTIRKTIKWLIDWDEKGNLVEIETSYDGKETLSVKPLTQPMGLIFYLSGRFDLIYK